MKKKIQNSYCASAFCAKHRLPESHVCPEIEKCRQSAFQTNASKVLNSKCVASKV
jgi:predicted nucleic acid binding AN1-type Zn finger protein